MIPWFDELIMIFRSSKENQNGTSHRISFEAFNPYTTSPVEEEDSDPLLPSMMRPDCWPVIFNGETKTRTAWR